MKWKISFLIFSFVLCGCATLSTNANKSSEVQQANNVTNHDTVDYVAIANANKIKKENYESEHPEQPLPKPDKSNVKSTDDFLSALYSLGFVTRNPDSKDPREAYVKIGDYHLTMLRTMQAMKAYDDSCSRISAYSGENYKEYCNNKVVNSLKNFSRVLKNPDIPNLTKQVALNESSYGSAIDFNRAANLSLMHYRLCSQKSNIGYVAMVSQAVPCSGRGDVLSIRAADIMGVL